LYDKLICFIGIVIYIIFYFAFFNSCKIWYIYENILYTYYIMPQLIPFFFVNQAFFTFVLLAVLVFTFSKYILPRFVRLFITRMFINKL
jgi:F-type H+-transporting ATPase subunit 8